MRNSGRLRAALSAQEGAVTAELAVALPAVMGILVLLALVASGQLARMALFGEAFDAARQVAIGASPSPAPNVQLLIQRSEQRVCATAKRPLLVDGWFSRPFELTATACSRELGQ